MKLPLYKAKIDLTDFETGVNAISLVRVPATEVDFVLLEKDTEEVKFSIQDEEKHLVTGVILTADSPIYRRIDDYEFFIQFDKETIRQISQKMLRFGGFNNINTDHNNDSRIEGIQMQEIYFKDVANGIDPKGFENVNDGSLFGSYKVDSIELWDELKQGRWKGFSIDGIVRLEEVEPEDTELDEVLSLIEQLKNKMK